VRIESCGKGVKVKEGLEGKGVKGKALKGFERDCYCYLRDLKDN
jgi:hypothetical protein